MVLFVCGGASKLGKLTAQQPQLICTLSLHTQKACFLMTPLKYVYFEDLPIWFVCLMLNIPVNNFSVMLGQSHRFLGITSTFLGGKYVLLKDTTQRPELVLSPRPLDPESEVLTTRPPRPRGSTCENEQIGADLITKLPSFAHFAYIMHLSVRVLYNLFHIF